MLKKYAANHISISDEKPVLDWIGAMPNTAVRRNKVFCPNPDPQSNPKPHLEEAVQALYLGLIFVKLHVSPGHLRLHASLGAALMMRIMFVHAV